MAPSCCPKGAEPLLANVNHVPTGEMVVEGDLPLYVSKPPTPTKKGVIVFHDIFGVHSGRTKQLCDELASNGLFVVCPDFFDEEPFFTNTPKMGFSLGMLCRIICGMLTGTVQKKTRFHSWEASLRRKVTTSVMPFMQQNGITEFSSLGFCWGAYGALHCAALPEFKCAALFHPSVDGVCKSTKEVDMEICKAARCNILCVSTKMEAKPWQPGGEAEEALKAAVPGSVEFQLSEQKHGYMCRAEIDKDAVAKEAVFKGVADVLALVEKSIAQN